MQQPNTSPDPNSFFLSSYCEPALRVIQPDVERPVFSNLWGSSGAALISGTVRATHTSFLVITGTDTAAEAFFKDLRFWSSLPGEQPLDVLFFPSTEVLPYEWSTPHPDIVRKRIQTLHRLSRRTGEGHDKPILVVSSIHAAYQKLIHPAALRDSALTLSTGEETNRDNLIEDLHRLGHSRTPMVTHPGEYTIRGGILDIFPTSDEVPFRMEWTGDVIESIRTFDPETQVSEAAREQFIVLPAGEQVEKTAASLWDYLPPGTRTAWDEPGIILDQAEAFEEEIKLAADSPPETAPKSIKSPRPSYLSLKEIESRLRDLSSILLQALSPGPGERGTQVSLDTRSTENAGLGKKGTPLERSLEIINKLRAVSRVLVAAKTDAQRDRIVDLFNDHDVPAGAWTTAEPGLTGTGPGGLPVRVLSGELSGGFIDTGKGLSVLTDEDLFGKAVKHRPLPKPRKARFLAGLEELTEGDYVVHVQHGIGQYEGLRRMAFQEFESDFLVLRYLGGDTLYVPVDHMNLVQKYSGVETHSPRVDRLGGITWAKTTRKVKKAVETMAREILELYAARETTRGYPFSKDTAMTREFDAAFPYEETPDQARTIGEVRADMEKPRPMDRLVCGDVGYGKTEVAMRAAFKAVMDGKQVGILVPTTLLAQQHGETFQERFAPFPVHVETLSRFKKAKDQKIVMKDLKDGKVDILIGTHRLLQKDVEFQDLGLLIIDEEQRFGVRHKEKMKQFRKSVDTLTLTATPIPRTLQLSLTGIRELSIIETPPADRLAVRTILTRFDGELIRNAIRRELSRDGQVFFVHNRIHDIARIGQLIKDLVPEARVSVAHGRMNERELERVMRDFVHHETNVLLTTTIIESGLDIPSANTILINDAQRFGLSDLYQLRGRVGRSGHQAYAYLLVPSERGMTEEARARIEAIREFCDLGAGFRIAARDLEIRGSGNFLGVQQSGHIAAVGFEYYLQLIEQSVREMQGEAVEEGKEPAINLRASAFLPHDYIPDTFQRLSVYKRLSGFETGEELEEFKVEMRDRYGLPPAPVRCLFDIVNLRLISKRAGIEKITSGDEGFTVVFDSSQALPQSAVDRILKEGPDRIRLLSEYSIFLKSKPEGPSAEGDWDRDYDLLKTTLQDLLF